MNANSSAWFSDSPQVSALSVSSSVYQFPHCFVTFPMASWDHHIAHRLALTDSRKDLNQIQSITLLGSTVGDLKIDKWWGCPLVHLWAVPHPKSFPLFLRKGGGLLKFYEGLWASWDLYVLLALWVFPPIPLYKETLMDQIS